MWGTIIDLRIRFRVLSVFSLIKGGPRDMYPNLNLFSDPTRFFPDLPNPYSNDPYQAWDREGRYLRFPNPGGFRSPFDP